MNLLELVVVGCVGDRREMKNRIEFFVAELLAPIERRQIFGDKIASVSPKILEVAGAKIIDYGQARVRKFLLQGEREIGTDEASSAGDKQVERRSTRGHRIKLVVELIK